MNESTDNLLREIATYYTNKLAEFGNTPRGVDWNGRESQIIRFEQLCKLIDKKVTNFSLTDLGCGYGALLDYVSDKFAINSYLGVDVSEDMISAAQSFHANSKNTKFVVGSDPEQISDYVMASGIFNVKLEVSDNDWFNYIQNTLDILNKKSSCGFAFNCLTSYSDRLKMRDYLYYSDPCLFFDLCKRKYSSQVSLLHDYGLYEFTIIVRKI